MTDSELDQILRAAQRLASAARFEGIALTGKASDDYRHRQQVTAAAWTAFRATVETSVDRSANCAAGPSAATEPCAWQHPAEPSRQRLEAYTCP